MSKRQAFIESVRSASKDLKPEQLAGFEALIGGIYDANQAQFASLEVTRESVDQMITAKVGDLGTDKTVVESIRGLDEALKLMKQSSDSNKGFYASLREAFEANKTAIEYTRNGGTVKLTVRADAGVITMANIVAPKSLGARDTQVDSAPLLPEVLPSMLITEYNLGHGSNPWVWMERNKGNGSATGVAEGGSKPFIDYTWSEKEVTSKTIAAIVPISKKATWNYPTLEAEVRGELLDELKNEYNRQIINGADSATEIKGIKSVYATEFVTTGIEIENANYWDVLSKAWLQSRRKVKGQRPTAILMSAEKISDLELEKDKNGNYLLPLWLTDSQKALKGARVIECDYLTENEVLIGSFNKAEFNYVQTVTIEVGWINDQFQKNQYSIRGEFDGMLRVKAHKNNFIKITNIEDAKTAITKVNN